MNYCPDCQSKAVCFRQGVCQNRSKTPEPAVSEKPASVQAEVVSGDASDAAQAVKSGRRKKVAE